MSDRERETFPASSRCRTLTVFSPSLAVNALPHRTPPSTEYSTAAPNSIPVTKSVPSLVMLSAALDPVS